MKFEIRVPATTANLGPGFDTAGIALTLYNIFTFDFTKEDGHIFYDEKHDFNDSLTLETFFSVLTRFDISIPKHISLLTQSNIPIARGLGSSSTCIVAGLLAANTYGNLNLTKNELVKLAADFEGHPDNVAPCLCGNLCLSVYDATTTLVDITKVDASLSFIAISPHETVSTKKARALLPKTYALADIIYSLSRASILANAFKEGNHSYLKTVTQDRLHEPYRLQLIQDYNTIKDSINDEYFITSWISGSGPTIIALTDINRETEAYHTLQSSFGSTHQITLLKVDQMGAQVTML